MNYTYNQVKQNKEIKRSLENSALNSCRDDLSDVNFEIGRKSYISQALTMGIVLFIVIGGRILLRRRVNPEFHMSFIDILFWIIIGLTLLCTVIYSIVQSKKPRITVSGKRLFYGGLCYMSDRISCVKCTKWENVEVYSHGKKVLSFPWERDNSELFIAWAKKCGIDFEDYRTA